MDTYAGDPFAPASLHKYTYCYGNPVNRFDPSGRMGIAMSLAVSGIIALGLTLWLHSVHAHFGGALKAAFAGDIPEAARNVAWAMLDLLALEAGPIGGAGSGLATSLSGVATSAAELVILSPAVAWGYLSWVVRMASAAGGGASSDGGGASGSSGSSGGPGQWVPENQSGWSESAKAYQAQITGRPGEAYNVNGVRFDGFDGTTLLDAKDHYSMLLENGQWKKWFDPQCWSEIAKRQVAAARSYPIVWHFAEQEVADAVRPLVQSQRIQVVHTPPVP